MRNTTQEAEDTEPLLAKNLYDTVRKANEQKIPEALKATQQLVDAGIAEEAAKAARSAGQGIEQLRQGIERAAESVLGDETAALRRAQGELDDLAEPGQPRDRPATGAESPGRDAAAQPGSQRRPRAAGPARRTGAQDGQPGQKGQQDPHGEQQTAQQAEQPAPTRPARDQQGQRPTGPAGTSQEQTTGPARAGNGR